ncbi:hypothetical protein Lgee_1040 [Legionella geestiana]|uniref:Uncharacterized protein n=1 Tax=Legionella geestiana TaxID=45065 RepID=A0A0W0TWV8_9GAMM|nr:hypothetical protein [Legionella geestiana]KTD00128.1 hypothetical protein Lgee_1040 [Legionella geestiana]QBS11826.1 hypothetical protein E4T54_03170 [Legionella geestiana]QDQ40559.1 hypothetical protein E3226_009240 [Legionella geestiana]STX53479.1 Uncharacterised protein [Legionella geestiana]
MRFAIGKGPLSAPYQENPQGIAKMQEAILRASQTAPNRPVYFATDNSDKKSAPCSAFNDRGQLRIGFKKRGVFGESLSAFLKSHFMPKGVFRLPADKPTEAIKLQRGNPVSREDSRALQAEHVASMRNMSKTSTSQPPVTAAPSADFRQNMQQLRDQAPDASFRSLLTPYRSMGRTFFCGTKVPEHIGKISKTLDDNRLTEPQKIARIQNIATDALKKNPLLRDSQLQRFYEKLNAVSGNCSTLNEVVEKMKQPAQPLNTHRGPARP